jgi:uncharacterized lipoprotein
MTKRRKVLLVILLIVAAVWLLAGCGLFQETREVTADGRTNTVVVVHTNVTAALNTARDVVTAVPTPWSGIAAGALGLVGAVLAAIAKIKSDNLRAVIAGVESAANDDVKAEIARVAKSLGVHKRLDRQVQRLTK